MKNSFILTVLLLGALACRELPQPGTQEDYSFFAKIHLPEQRLYPETTYPLAINIGGLSVYAPKVNAQCTVYLENKELEHFHQTFLLKSADHNRFSIPYTFREKGNYRMDFTFRNEGYQTRQSLQLSVDEAPFYARLEQLDTSIVYGEQARFQVYISSTMAAEEIQVQVPEASLLDNEKGFLISWTPTQTGEIVLPVQISCGQYVRQYAQHIYVRSLLQMQQDSLFLTLGAPAQLPISIIPENTPVQSYSNNPLVATAHATHITPVSAGMCKIYYASADWRASCIVIVKDNN